jgi:hypothetical protein
MEERKGNRNKKKVLLMVRAELQASKHELTRDAGQIRQR